MNKPSALPDSQPSTIQEKQQSEKAEARPESVKLYDDKSEESRKVEAENRKEWCVYFFSSFLPLAQTDLPS